MDIMPEVLIPSGSSYNDPPDANAYCTRGSEYLSVIKWRIAPIGNKMNNILEARMTSFLEINNICMLINWR
ncbi:MAG: hypothetical protein AAGC85_10520 [Bacteroidota bacterium]